MRPTATPSYPPTAPPLPLTLLQLLLLLATSAACNRRAYVTDDFPERTAHHVSIAVLPYEVTYTGRQPRGVTEADVEAQERWEALAYQQDLVDQIGRRAGRHRRALTVDLQATSETAARLERAGIEPTEAHRVPTERLCAVLGVEAVAVARVRQHRVLTELESTIASVASIVLQSARVSQANGALNRTFHVDLSLSVVDAAGAVLFNDNSRTEIAAGRTLEEAITRVNRDVVRRLPYIERE